MIFMGKNIGCGDQIYTFTGDILRIDNWSPGTGEVWAYYSNSFSSFRGQVCLNHIRDHLTWNFPFQSRRFHKFKRGDKVIYTNTYGVCWGVKTIKLRDVRTGRPTYYYENSDTPWFSVDQEHFKFADDEDLAAHERGEPQEWFQKKHGFEPHPETLRAGGWT